MELKYSKSPGSEHEIKLDSKLLSAEWLAGLAIGGQSVELEVRTSFVGNGAPVKIKGKSAKGKSLGSLDGEMRSNVFRGELEVPADIELGDEVYFEVKLSKNSLSGESNKIPAVPGVKVSELKWSTEEARRGDTLTLSAKVTDVRGEPEFAFVIYEYDRDGAHDRVIELPVEVKKDKAELEWEFEYFEDTDELPTKEEMEQYGREYNPPEYFFALKVDRVEYGLDRESGLLKFKDELNARVLDENGEPAANRKYKLILPDGEEREGDLDDDGRITQEDLPPGRCRLIIEEDETQEDSDS